MFTAPFGLALETQRIHHADIDRWPGAKRSGRCVSAPPMVIPPALVPRQRQLARRGVALLDEVFRAGDEVADRILLVEFLAGEMPVLAVFAAAAHVRVGDDDALLQQREPRGVEVGIEADAVGAVALDQAGILAVHLEVLPVDDGKRNRRAVGARAR